MPKWNEKKGSLFTREDDVTLLSCIDIKWLKNTQVITDLGLTDGANKISDFSHTTRRQTRVYKSFVYIGKRCFDRCSA